MSTNIGLWFTNKIIPELRLTKKGIVVNLTENIHIDKVHPFKFLLYRRISEKEDDC